MSRAEENEAKRERQKITKIISRFSPQQKKVIDIVGKERAQVIAGKYITEMKQIIESCTCCVLYDEGLNALELIKKIDILMIKEGLEIEKEGIEVDKKLTREIIVNSARKHGLDTEGRRKIAKELNSTYSTVTTYISKWKITDEELKRPVIKIQPKEEVEEDSKITEAAEEILNIMEGGKEMNNKKVEEAKADKAVENKETVNPVVVTNATVEKANLNPSVQEKVIEQSKLKVLSMTLKGENGTYRACENGVEITEMNSIICFENIGQVDEWANEVKKVFAMLKA